MGKIIGRWMSVGLLALLASCGGGGGADGGSGSGAGGGAGSSNPGGGVGSGGGAGSGSGSETVNTPPVGALTFIPQADTAPASVVTSNPVVLSGMRSAASVSITGGEYSIDGGAFTSAPGSILNGQTIRVRASTPHSFSTTITVVLTVGGVSASFVVTTVAPDLTPDAFQFQPQFNVARNGWATSNAVTLAGIDAPAPISIEGGEYAIDGSAFTTTAGTIRAGQSLTIRVKAPALYTKVARARVTVGTISAALEAMSESTTFVPDSVDFDGRDVIFLLSNANSLVFRWSISQERYLEAYEVQPLTSISYSSAHQRLYLGYGTGDIQYIDVPAGTGQRVAFAKVDTAIAKLAAVGNYVLAQAGNSGAWVTHHVFNASGVVTARQDGYNASSEYAWDAASSRAFFFRDGISPNDLLYKVIDQATGQITSQGETPYHGSYNIQAPIRVSANGQYVLLGSGDLYKQPDLTWSGSLGAQVTDARWFADGTLVTLRKSGNQTTLRRQGTSLANLEQLTFSGEPVRILGSDAKMALVLVDNGAVQFKIYTPSNDSDGDGVTNTADAFPLDAAASVDTDHDGYPDAWNSGKTQGDSTTGLTLDAYPQDSACYLPSHGNGTNCNFSATIPDYIPDQVVQQGDIVYLLSSANKRVYRWSISSGIYLNPYVIGINQGFSSLVPTNMAYSSAQQRLYLGYSTGAIQYIDVSAGTGAEVPFAATAMAVNGLAAAGNYLLAQDGSGAWATHYVFNASGVVTDQKDWNYTSREYAWDAVSSRIYFFRDNMSPNDLHYEVIDQATGKITSAGETPYHGAYTIQPPIRVSANGQFVLLGSGDIYNQSGLTWSRSVGTQVADARWFADGSLVTLLTAGNQTTLRRLSGTTVLERLTFAGTALRVVGSDTKMVVLVANNGAVHFQVYVPSNDNDGDGVSNTADAFPLDAAASVDTDHDGYPDAWNAGKSQGDSTTGLSLDAYPNDSACYLASHGSGGTCNYASTVPNYVPDQIVQQGNIVYLLSSANKRVYRWSLATGQYVNPYVVGIDQGFSALAPTKMAYSSAQQRLYLGYSTGAIQYIDTSTVNGPELPFAITATAVNGLASVGNYVLAQDDSGAWETHYIFSVSGAITDQKDWDYISREYAWDAVNSRVYFFRDNSSPNDLHYEVIDQATGKITSAGETPYHGAYTIQPPIRVSVNGQYVLLGSGDIYNQSGLTWAGSLGMQIADARWFANGSLVTLITSGNQTTLRRLSTLPVSTVEQLTYAGQALRVVGSDAKMVVVVSNNGATQFHIYVPNNDSDGDGVPNTSDAFPLDPAASVDTDHDGYPSSWNAGKSQSDSTTGLTLDAYPNDSACYLPGHGSGGVCNYGSTVPDYVPEQIVSQGNTIYLLSSANKRVYRWSIATGQYLNPYVVGIDQGFGTLAPTKMAYSSVQQRLYLGYSTGAIQYIDVSAGTGAQVPFAATAMAVNGLAAAGNYLLAQDGSGAWATHYVFNASGVITAQKDWNYASSEYTWDAVSSRIYFFRDGMSPNDLHYEVIDQATGQITSAGETPYHGNYSIQAPIRVSADGELVLLGAGDLYNKDGLTWAGSLGTTIKDAQWVDNLLVDVDTFDKVEIRDADSRVVLKSYQYLGQPLRIVFGVTDAYLVHVMNNTTTFLKLPFGDQDNDSMPLWWEQFYGFSDTNAADATGDADGDGVSNANEYLNHSNPTLADTDGDGLSDFQEIVTYSTDPTRADSDGDGLNDKAEVVTYHTDPWDKDSDNDGYSDQDEVLFGGNPNNPSAVPPPLLNYSESFEGGTIPAGWTTPAQGTAPWAIDFGVAASGSKSLKAGPLATSQSSSRIRFRAVFANGQLGFQTMVDAPCCEQLVVLLDGVQQLYSPGNSQWGSYAILIPPGVHEVEWQFLKNGYSPYPPGSAWIDDVTFVGH